MTDSKTNLLGLDYAGMVAFFEGMGEKPYRAQQLIQAIHQKGIQDLHAITTLSKDLRQTLAEIAEVRLPKVIFDKTASDGTRKWVIQLDDSNCIETVLIPAQGRNTLCISSQVGCILNCDFCSTGKQGFNRNLTTAEVISQLWIAVRALSEDNGVHDRKITNVVMMGMGEPLLNTENVFPSLNLMRDELAYGLSKYRVTVSTSGVIPAMKALREASDVSLAVSLHAPNNELRNKLVPLNKKYPLEVLMKLCRDYFETEPKREITMEYVMLDGVNDQLEHAKQLIQLLKHVSVKMNLIPFNPFPHTVYKRSSNDVIEAFQKILISAGIHTNIRRTRGDDIDAACGQLVGQVQDRTRRNERYLRERVNLTSLDSTA